MSFTASAFNVMIASPNDVMQERKIVRETIHEWNDAHSMPRGIVLLPVGWESHSYPQAGARPQSIINTQILQSADILIAVFWTRLGTPTGAAESGTVEEIREHIKAGKPTMIYFSTQPVKLKSIDHAEHARLEEFQKECQGMSLYHEYEDPIGLAKDLSHHLAIMMNTHTYFHSIPNLQIEQPPAEISEEEKARSSLTLEAMKLLRGAASGRGELTTWKTMNNFGMSFETTNILATATTREIAQWREGLELLVRLELFTQSDDDDESFKVTAKGYRVADLIDRQLKAQINPSLKPA